LAKQARRTRGDPKPLTADLAIDLYQALVVARRSQLHPALSVAVHEVGVTRIDPELARLVPGDVLNHVASLGLRGERVFPIPSILTHSPLLIGYYRMLLGLSKKEFGSKRGYARWVTAEEVGVLRADLAASLDQFCAALIEPLVDLVAAVDVFDDRDLSDLALLTLGPTLQGGRNNVTGKGAAEAVFISIQSAVQPWITFSSLRVVRFSTPSGLPFELVAASDPDIRLGAGTGNAGTPLVAIEIKGGGDRSNAHNRAGEAEKSQIKARLAGYRHRWLVMVLGGVPRETLRQETPSTTKIFDADHIMHRSGPDWKAFRRDLERIIGAKLPVESG
jgi:hypothetical protein